MKLLIALSILVGSVVAQAAEVAVDRRPVNINQYDEWNLARLMKYRKAVADPVPWAGFWWPYDEGGIANATFDRHNESPAYKLDQAQGNSNWIVDWESANHGMGRSAEAWWGHCNGWATAAIMENEPRKARKVNGIDFTVADIKAALSEYWLESGADFIGTRVWDPGDTSSYAFWDVIPAQFHLLLTNIVGRQHRSVILDRHTGAEVWNQPLVAYEIDPIRPEDYLGPDEQYPNVYRVNMTATIYWANDEVEADWLTPKFEWKENEYFSKRTLRYELWVDAPLEFDRKGNLERAGNIIITDQSYGGQWKNGMTYDVLVNSHPDFMWIPLSYAQSSGAKNPRLNDAWVHENFSH